MARTVIGLVGCGIWGTLVLRDLSSLGVSVVVADTDEAARASATTLGATTVGEASELPEVDALVVATPAVTHAAVADVLLPRGVPMLVEKPFTTSVPDAERLAARGGDRLFVGHVWRYHPGIEQLGEIARSGDIGPIAGLRSTRTNWTSPRTDVDSIWNLAPHDLTLAIEILGGIPEPRAALAEVQDGRAVGLIALLGDEPWLAFDVSNRYRDKRREVRLHGGDGVAVLRDPDAGQIEITRGDAATRRAPAIDVRDVPRESALRRQLAAFLGVLDGGPPPKSPAAEGVEVVKALVRLRELAGLGSEEHASR
jgi:predicted dehydrogenase